MTDEHRAWKRQGEAFWRAHHEAWKRSDLNQRQLGFHRRHSRTGARGSEPSHNRPSAGCSILRPVGAARGRAAGNCRHPRHQEARSPRLGPPPAAALGRLSSSELDKIELQARNVINQTSQSLP
jgi:hypothetical protein